MAAPKPTFWSWGSFRIMNCPELHQEIIAVFGPGDYCHRKGEEVPEKPGTTWQNDICAVNTPIPERSEIEEHLQWLCDFVGPYEDQIRGWISRGAKVDFYFSYACNDNHRGFGLSPELLAIFPRLGIRLEVSILT